MYHYTFITQRLKTRLTKAYLCYIITWMCWTRLTCTITHTIIRYYKKHSHSHYFICKINKIYYLKLSKKYQKYFKFINKLFTLKKPKKKHNIFLIISYIHKNYNIFSKQNTNGLQKYILI